ncbi:MAG TPA: ankyrin repeat domain-containing protein [Thermoanaerobaculia bacterium]|nr:ankyrin repeat domain-containing protein [Thermoanaerobaculia bacterium]
MLVLMMTTASPNPDYLVSAILNGDVDQVKQVLEAGVDPNDPRMIKPGLRLAATACIGQRVETETIVEMIDVLLAHGAKPNLPSDKELSALMTAAQQCPAPVVLRLVKAGADMKFKTSLGITPLSMAFIVGNLDAAEALIDSGARLSAEAAAKLKDNKKDDERYHALLKRAQAK